MSLFKLRPDTRVCVLIDGPHLYASSRNLGFEVDYKAMLAYFEENCNLQRAMYFTSILEGEEFNPIKRLADWLSYNGYKVVAKPIRDYTDDNGERRTKASLRVELAVELMSIPANVDHVILFAGDGDLSYAVERMQQRGQRVTVVSTIQTAVSSIANELRRGADSFVDLADVRSIIGRVHADEPRPEPVVTTRGRRLSLRTPA